MIGDSSTGSTDPANWQSTGFDTGIPDQLLAHLEYSVIALVDRAG